MHVHFRKTGIRNLAKAIIVAALLSTGCSTIVNSGQPTVSRNPDKPQRMNPWVWGNAALAVFPPAAVAGVVVDAYGGHWYEDVDSSIQPATAPALPVQPSQSPSPVTNNTPSVQPVQPSQPPSPVTNNTPSVQPVQPPLPSSPATNNAMGSASPPPPKDPYAELTKTK